MWEGLCELPALLSSSEAPACRRFIRSLWGLGVFNSTGNVRFFITARFNVEMSFHSLAPFHWETNLEIQPHWKHTWTSCLTNNLPWYQVAVTNVSHLKKIALIVKESFTSYWEAICWLLFLRNVTDGFSILQVRVSGRVCAADDVCHTKVQAKGALMIWRGDHWRRVKGNESFAKEMHQGDRRPEPSECGF